MTFRHGSRCANLGLRLPMRFTAYSYFVWGLTPLLQILILVAMMRKRLYTHLPFFATYTVFVLLHQAASYAAHRWGSPELYFYVGWGGEPISIILGFVVISEVFENLLEPYKSIRELANLLFRWAIFVAFFAAILTGLATPGGEPYRLMVGILSFEYMVRIIQFLLLVFLFSFAKTLGLSWRHYTFGIAFGFSLFALVAVVGYAVRMSVGSVSAGTVQALIPSAYLLAVLIWTGYLFRPVEVRDSSVLSASDLYRWNEALKEVEQRWRL